MDSEGCLSYTLIWSGPDWLWLLVDQQSTFKKHGKNATLGSEESTAFSGHYFLQFKLNQAETS